MCQSHFVGFHLLCLAACMSHRNLHNVRKGRLVYKLSLAEEFHLKACKSTRHNPHVWDKCRKLIRLLEQLEQLVDAGDCKQSEVVEA